MQLTRDGVAVVHHDAMLTRTTDVAARYPKDPRRREGYRLSDFDWDEIRELDAGAWFVEEHGGRRSAHEFGTLAALPRERRERYRSGIIRIPSLVDALELTVDLDWLVNIEIKSFPEDPPGLIDAVLGAIRSTGSMPRVLISSFDHRDLVRVAALVQQSHDLPLMPLGALIDSPLASPVEYLRGAVGANTYHVSARSLGAESISYRHHPGVGSLRRETIEELSAARIPVLVYTVNDHRRGGLADHLRALGAAGIFTDDPAGMRSLFVESGS